MSVFSIECLKLAKRSARPLATLALAIALIVPMNDAMAQNQGQGQGQGQGQNQQPALTGTQATVVIPPGQTSVTLVVNGAPQTFNAGDVIDLSQDIAVPATSTVAFAMGDGSSVEPAGGSSFSVSSSGNNVTVNLTSGSASATSSSNTNTVTISNGNGVAITGSDVSSSYNPATQESTAEVNSGTATLTGSATNGAKTVVANNITLNAGDQNTRVFSVSFDDGANQNTNSGFRSAQNTPQTPNVPNTPQVPVTVPQLANILPTFVAPIVPPAQVDSSSPAAP